jgi:hypothetical protein
VNLAFAIDDFDVTKHWPHPPDHSIYVAAGKLVHLFIADHARALTLVSICWMLFIMLPTGHLRYFLPLSLIVGGSVSGYLTLLQRPVVRGLG